MTPLITAVPHHANSHSLITTFKQPPALTWDRGSNTMMSSRRFRNSGGKWERTMERTCRLRKECQAASGTIKGSAASGLTAVNQNGRRSQHCPGHPCDHDRLAFNNTSPHAPAAFSCLSPMCTYLPKSLKDNPHGSLMASERLQDSIFHPHVS